MASDGFERDEAEPSRPGRRHREGAEVRSDKQYLGVERSLQRARAKGAGLIDEKFDRPMVAVGNL